MIVRLVELDGKPQPDVRVSLRRADHRCARSERAGAAGWAGNRDRRRAGDFVQRLSAAHVCRQAGGARGQSCAACAPPGDAAYDLAAASNDGTPSGGGFDGKGNALPAEMLPRKSHSTMCGSNSRRRRPARPTRSWRRGKRSICLPAVTTAFTCWRLGRWRPEGSVRSWQAKVPT